MRLPLTTISCRQLFQQIHGSVTFVESIKFIAQLRICFIEWVFLGLKQAGQNSVVKSEAPYFFEFFCNDYMNKTMRASGIILIFSRIIPNVFYIVYMIIPFAEEDQVRWLIDDWIQLTRKDLAKVEGVPIVDPRQAPAKEYNHPPDSMMACIYAMAASARHREAEWFWISA